MVKKEDLLRVLYAQQDRGLDGLGIVDGLHYFKLHFKSYIEYRREIKKNIRPKLSSNFIVMHHRKATIGDISIANSHPFTGKKFIIMQNGTSKAFHKLYENEYPGETDTEKLLHYIEARVETLEEIPAEMTKLTNDLKYEYFGALFFIDTNGRILFYTDGGRETYVDIEDNTLKGIYSYKPGTSEGFDNDGYVILDNTGHVLLDKMPHRNKFAFYKPCYYPNRLEQNLDIPTVSEVIDNPMYSWNNPILDDESEDYIKEYLDLDEYDYCFNYITEHMFELINMTSDEAFNKFLSDEYYSASMAEYELVYGHKYPASGFYNAWVDTFSK